MRIPSLADSPPEDKPWQLKPRALRRQDAAFPASHLCAESCEMHGDAQTFDSLRTSFWHVADHPTIPHDPNKYPNGQVDLLEPQSEQAVLIRSLPCAQDLDSNDDDAVVLMQRNRSRSRDDHDSHQDDIDDDIRDPTASSSTNCTDRDSAHVQTWTFVSRESYHGRLDLPEGQLPTRADASVAMFCHIDEISSVHPVQHLYNEQDEYIVLVVRTSEESIPSDHTVVYAEVMCLHDQPPGGIPRPPEMHYTIWVLPQRATRDEFVHKLNLDAIVNAYPWFVTILHNGRTWEVFDQRSRSFAHGDYVQIRLAPHQNPDHKAQLTEWLLDASIGLWESLISYAPNSTGDQRSIESNPTIQQHTPTEQDSCRPTLAFGGISVQSWYISHTRHKKCPLSRVLTLSQDSNTWIRDIEVLWNDIIEPGSMINLHWVVPQPWSDSAEPQQNLPHLIIEQHNCYRQVAMIITTRVMRDEGVHHEQAAFSMPELTTADSFLIATSNEFLCSRSYDCEVSAFHRTIDSHVPARRPSGISVNIVMTPRARTQEAHDSTTLLQVTTRAGPLTGHGGGRVEPISSLSNRQCPTGMEAPESQHPPRAEASAGDRLSDRQKQFTQDRVQFGSLMQLAWTTDAAEECQEEGPVLYVRTFYVSPLRMPHCYVSRAVRLTLPMEEWQDKLREVWIDLIDPSQHVDFYVVMPKPPDTLARRGNGAYVILAQQLGHHESAVLLTTVEDDTFTHAATIVAPEVTRRELLVHAGLYPRCFRMDQLLQCTASHGGTIIRDDAPTAVRNGFGFLIVLLRLPDYMGQGLEQVPPVPHPDAEEDPDDTDLTDNHSRPREGPAPPPANPPAAIPNQSNDPHVEIDFEPVYQERANLLEIPLPLLTQWPVEVTIPANILSTLLQYPVWDQTSAALEIQIFTDGSCYKGGHPGAAVVLFVRTETGWTLGGILATASPGSAAFQGEHAAMIWAMIWTLKITHWIPMKPQVTFVFDAMTTGKQTFESWQSHAHPKWWIIMRSLHQCLQSEAVPTKWMHTYAHRGTFGNELADLAAKHATTMSVSPDDPIAIWLENPTRYSALQWIWTLRHFDQQHKCLPKMQGHRLVHSLASEPIQPRHVHATKVVRSRKPPPQIRHQLTLATANVLSLKTTTGKPGTCAGARQLGIAAQFSAHQVHVVCLQETRHRRTAKEVDDYFVIDHPARQGHEGVQIWFNTKLKIGRGTAQGCPTHS
eukprot:Skav221484  [mRNA]  locus=scaffold1514:126405:130756:+ [translate_table: standard]